MDFVNIFFANLDFAKPESNLIPVVALHVALDVVTEVALDVKIALISRYTHTHRELDHE